MTPLEVAEKWMAAAHNLWFNMSHTGDIERRLLRRVRAHYGDVQISMAHIASVACVEAMNEYEINK